MPLIFHAPRRSYRFRAGVDRMHVASFIKAPAEQFPISLDLRGALPLGRLPSLVELSAIDVADDSAANSVLDRTTGTSTGYVVEGVVKAGTLGHRYQIRFDVTDQYLSLYAFTVQMVVREA